MSKLCVSSTVITKIQVHALAMHSVFRSPKEYDVHRHLLILNSYCKILLLIEKNPTKFTIDLFSF